MTVVSSKEFVINQKKYFDMAVNEQICIKRGKNMFQLVHTPVMDDDDDNDTELLALAKSRRNKCDREFTGVDEFINFLEK